MWEFDSQKAVMDRRRKSEYGENKFQEKKNIEYKEK